MKHVHACLGLKNSGFVPDVIISHPGWGESLFLKDIWPNVRLGIYCEFFYNYFDSDIGFDPEFTTTSADDACRFRFKNLNNSLHFEIADLGISPTSWQANSFPASFNQKITTIHDGINTDIATPNKNVSLTLGDGTSLNCESEIITFVNRDLEPYRGYHIFMRALPYLLQNRPNSIILIVGGDGVSYGAKAPEGQSWKSIFIDEVRPLISDSDWSRVKFLGTLPYSQFIPLLQLSSVHIYLTYPFVLSWSLLEAMSVGCAVVASDTPPVSEVITHDTNGILIDFFDSKGLAQEVSNLLDNKDLRDRLGQNARASILTNYDLHTVCLPRQIQWIYELAK